MHCFDSKRSHIFIQWKIDNWMCMTHTCLFCLSLNMRLKALRFVHISSTCVQSKCILILLVIKFNLTLSYMYGKMFQDHSHVLISILVHANDHFAGLPRMQALIRIANIPIVETGVKTAGKVYYSIKVSTWIVWCVWIQIKRDKKWFRS